MMKSNCIQSCGRRHSIPRFFAMLGAWACLMSLLVGCMSLKPPENRAKPKNRLDVESQQSIEPTCGAASNNSIMRSKPAKYEKVLISNNVNDIAVDEANVWVATDRGVSRFERGSGKWLHYTKEDGLSTNNVNAVAADGNLVWFGTDEGVTRLNLKSNRWRTYKRKDGLTGNKITCITVDGYYVWFGTDGGLNRYDKRLDSWAARTERDGLTSNAVTAIVAESQFVWVGTRQKPERYKDRYDFFFAGKKKKRGSVNRYDKTLDSWNTYSKKNGLVDDNISTIAVDENYVWFGSYDAGVSKYSKTNQAFIGTYTKRDLLSSDKISDIAVDGINIWFGTAEAGVQRYIKPVETWTKYTRSDGLASDNISCIAVFQNEVWFGARESGVSKYDKKTGNFTTFVEAEALPDNNVMDLEIQETSNRLWAATAKGLGMYDLKRKEWSHYGKESGLPDDYITTVRSGSGELWVGTAQGLVRLDEKSSGWKPYLKGKFITDLEVADNFIWTGTGKGLFRVSADGKATFVTELADKRVTCIESNGTYLWIGTKDGLWKYDTITGETSLYTTTQGIGDNFINALLAVDASIWVGTRGGLSKYDEMTDRWHTYTEQDGLPNDNVRAIAYDSKRNSLWVGTPAGLTKFSIDKKIFTTVLEDYNIKTIETSGDSLWLGATTGVIEFDVTGKTPIYGVKTQYKSLPESEPLRERNVSNLVSDGDDLWFSNWSTSADGAIIRFDRHTNIWKRYTKENIFGGGEEKPITWVRWISVGMDSVWFATDYGALRYDKCSDTWYHYTISDGLASNDTQKIVVGDDSVWVIAASGTRISRYDKSTGKWNTIALEGTLPIDSVKSIAIDGEDVWIGLSASGIRKFNKVTGEWTSYTVADGLAQNGVGWISADERYVWVGHIGRSSESALSCYDKIKGEWQTYSTPLLLDNEILKIVVGDRYTWILYPTRKHLGCTQFDRKAEQWTTISRPEGVDNITDVIEDGEYIWFSTEEDGVFSLHTASGERTRFEDDLLSDRVSEQGLLIDENSVWVGTPMGLCRYDKNLESWIYYTKERTLEGEDVYAVAVDDRYVWCGTDQGLSRYDKIRGDWKNFRGERKRKWSSSSGRLINNFVLSLAVDDRYVWVGTISGVSRYDKIAAAWESFTMENGLPGERIVSIALDTNYVWAGTDFGIGRYPRMTDDPNAWIPYTAEVSIKPVDSKEYVSTLASNEVQCIAVDKDYLWVGTKRGVSRYDKSSDNWISYTSEDGLIADAVSSVAITKDAVWFATADGVSMYNPKSRDWITFTTKDGLASNKITCILYDNDSVWFGTFDAGLTRYDLEKKRWRTYTKTDGLAHNSVLSIAADLNYLWVGTRHGLNRYDKITDAWTTYAGTR